MQNNIDSLEMDVSVHLDDLDTALVLMSKLPVLYHRLDQKSQQTLLQIIAKQIMIDPSGDIVDQKLHSPFTYLKSLVDDFAK